MFGSEIKNSTCTDPGVVYNGCPSSACDDDTNSWCITEASGCDGEEVTDGGGWMYCGVPPSTLAPQVGDSNLLTQLVSSVGEGGTNNPSDVKMVKERLLELGFDQTMDGNNGQANDGKLIPAIKLFQRINALKKC